MELLYQDEYFVAINKPSGVHVHPHEDIRHRVHKSKIALYLVRNQLKQHVFPVHRLDAGTSGVLLFALSSESASKLCKLFSVGETKKIYHAVVRGYTQSEGSIEIPLESDSSANLLTARTDYKRLKIIELPFAVGKKFPTARYSWVEVYPQTGRFHQIRRHFNRISHPLVGDAVHGDSHHNRFFRDQMGISGLCLKATSIEFLHPFTQKKISICAPTCDQWQKIELLFEQLTPQPLTGMTSKA